RHHVDDRSLPPVPGRNVGLLDAAGPEQPVVDVGPGGRWLVGAHESATVMTTFPCECPASTYRMASGLSRRGYVRSITGVTFPASMRPLPNRRSSALRLAMHGTTPRSA